VVQDHGMDADLETPTVQIREAGLVLRPWLPEDDRPPAGLGRLIPVGAQIEEECRRGVVALEHWLLSHRQAGRGGA